MTIHMTNALKSVIQFEIDNLRYVLRLYVSGMTPRSRNAILRIEKICKEQFDDKYTLEVIDIRQHPVLAKYEQVIATPTLMKLLPLPLRRIVGDFSDQEGVLFGLDLSRRNYHDSPLAHQPTRL
jgi:circadian clock protein KaiB